MAQVNGVALGMIETRGPFGCLFCPLLGDDGAEMGGLNFSG